MWRDETVHERHPLKQDVRDIECGEQPLVLRGGKVQVFTKAGYRSVSNIWNSL